VAKAALALRNFVESSRIEK